MDPLSSQTKRKNWPMSGADQRAGKPSLAGPALIAVRFQATIPWRVAPQQKPASASPADSQPIPFPCGHEPSARQPVSPISCLTQGVQSTTLTPIFPCRSARPAPPPQRFRPALAKTVPPGVQQLAPKLQLPRQRTRILASQHPTQRCQLELHG